MGHLGFFGGGSNVNPVVYDGLSNSWSTLAQSQARSELAATSVGDTALFGGGYGSDLVDLFIVPEPAAVMVVVLAATFLRRRSRPRNWS